MTVAIISSRGDDATVRSVRRALAILRAFGPADRSLPLGEIARRAELDKATTRRLLRTLIGENVVEQHGPSKEYSLGLGVLELSAGATPVDDLRRRAQPLLAATAETTGATALLAVRHDGAALCIEAVAGERPVQAPWSTGERLPLHACAAPRVLMAYLPLETRMAVLSGPLPSLTGGTPTDPFQLATTLETIRQRGWETGVDDVIEGVTCLALPVRGEAGEVIAAFAIAGPGEEMLDGDRPLYLELVRSKVQELERRLGARPAPPGGSARRAH